MTHPTIMMLDGIRQMITATHPHEAQKLAICMASVTGMVRAIEGFVEAEEAAALTDIDTTDGWPVIASINPPMVVFQGGRA